MFSWLILLRCYWLYGQRWEVTKSVMFKTGWFPLIGVYGLLGIGVQVLNYDRWEVVSDKKVIV